MTPQAQVHPLGLQIDVTAAGGDDRAGVKHDGLGVHHPAGDFEIGHGTAQLGLFLRVVEQRPQHIDAEEFGQL